MKLQFNKSINLEELSMNELKSFNGGETGDAAYVIGRVVGAALLLGHPPVAAAIGIYKFWKAVL